MFRENDLVMWGVHLVIVEYIMHTPKHGRAYGVRCVGTPHVFNVSADTLSPAPEPAR